LQIPPESPCILLVYMFTITVYRIIKITRINASVETFSQCRNVLGDF
jgi:hypothetical protein